MEQKTFLTFPVKIILASTILLLTALLLVIVGNPFKKPPAPMPSPTPAINKIEISADKKKILDAETKTLVFTIGSTQTYLKDAGYFYNPDTFQTTNAKYEGDCFSSAALSNNKDRIVFSTGCLPGDLPQVWVGIYTLPPCSNGTCLHLAVKPIIQFLIGGSGRNFSWSTDDKTITYEADLGLSGMTETQTFDSATGEILEKKNSPVTNNPEASTTKKIPDALAKVIIKDITAEYPVCEDKKVIISDYNFESQFVDLNSDGIEEVIITGDQLCDVYTSVAPRAFNIPVNIYQDRGKSWFNILSNEGQFNILDTKTNDYNDISFEIYGESPTNIIFKWNKQNKIYIEANN